MSTSLSAMRTRTRRYLNESSADRWSDSDIDAFINEGIRWIQSEIQAANVDYFIRIETATASGGSYQLALPSDIWGNRLRGLWYYENTTVASGTSYRVEPGQAEWVMQNVDYSGIPKNYYLLAGYLRFAPLMQYAGTFRFVYAKKEATLTNDTDVMDRIADEYADIPCLYAAIAAFDQYGLDPGTLPGRLERRLNQVLQDTTPIDPVVLPQIAIDDF